MPSDPFLSLAVFQLSMQPNSLLGREILLLEFELRRQIEQAELLLFFRNDFVEKCQMVAEKDDARRIVDLRLLSHIPLKENRSHRRDVLVAEAQIGAGETGVAWFHRWHADLTALTDHVPRKDFLGQRHRSCGRGA